MLRLTLSSQCRSRGFAILLLIVGVPTFVGCSDETRSGDSSSRPDARQDLPFADQSVGLNTSPTQIEADLAVIDRYVSGSDLRDLLARRDREAVDCLAERGFVVSLRPKQQESTVTPDFGITRRQFAEKWGFGQVAPITPDGGHADEFNDIAKRQSVVSMPTPAGAVPDPDIDWSSVDEADSLAVSEALFGVSDADPNAKAASSSPTCLDSANQAAGVAADGGAIAAGGSLRQLAAERVANDPEILDAQQDYRSCMSATGFPDLSSPYDALLSITKEFGALREAAFATVADGAIPNVSTIGPELEEKFRVLQQREIAVAVANVACEGDYLEAAQPRSDAIQQEVIDANPALVAQLGGDA